MARAPTGGRELGQVIIGTALGTVVTSLVKDIIAPIIGLFGGQPDFSALDFKINGSTFRYGAFINAVITFLIVGLVMFLLVKATLRLFKEKPTAQPSRSTSAIKGEVVLSLGKIDSDILISETRRSV